MSDTTPAQLTVDADALRRIASELDRTVHYLVQMPNRFVSGKTTSFGGDDNRERLQSCLEDLTIIRQSLNGLVSLPASTDAAGAQE